MDEEFEGECSWFGSGGQSFGFLKYAEGEIYVHYKHISEVNQRDIKFRELKKYDKVKFKRVEGHNGVGSQADEVEILEYADND